MSLAARLAEAADWLAEEIPSDTKVIEHLEGDVRLDELDLYVVNILREAAAVLDGAA